DLAADIVEIHVDTFAAQRLCDVFALVIDRHVVAVELGQIAGLLRAARDADRAATRKLRQLPGDLSYRTRGGGNDDRVARPRLADVEQSEVRSESRQADGVQSERRWVEYRRDDAERPGTGGRVFLPAELSDHEIARAETRILALHNLSEVHRRDDVSELQ